MKNDDHKTIHKKGFGLFQKTSRMDFFQKDGNNLIRRIEIEWTRNYFIEGKK
ncbi:MAG TPA: hypothetical protein VGB26_00895 [Nitrospiria bacterium]